MKPASRKRKELSSATLTQSLWLIWGSCLAFAVTASAADPTWWTNSGAGAPPAVMAEEVVTNGGVVSTNYVPNPNAVVVQGQLKQFTARAVDEMNAHLTGGAGTNLNAMMTNWATDYATNGYNGTNAKPSDYSAITVGQLKYIGHDVWSQLVTGGYTNAVPSWLAANTNSDGQLAVLGQLKEVFDFDLGSGSPGGIPDWWELQYFGQTGLDPSSLAPNGSGLTLLECYQDNINPQQAAPSTPFAISMAATGPFQSLANPLIVCNITHPSTTTIVSVDFYSDSTHLGTLTQAPYEWVMSTLTPGRYTITAVATQRDNVTLAETTTQAQVQFQVTEGNFYSRGVSGDPVYESTIVTIDSEQGQYLDEEQNTGSTNFSGLYPNGYPWFLRTQKSANESNELWKHISGFSGSTPAYTNFNVYPTINGAVVGGAPPLAAFGSQGGLSPLYTGQNYNFGVAAGGQLVFSPITITSITSANPSVYTVSSVAGLHVGQMIVISGAVGNTSVNGTYLVSSITTATKQIQLTDPLANSVHGITGYTNSSGSINNADMKIEVYQASSFASNATNVAPVYTQGYTLPRPTNTNDWNSFVNNGYVEDYPITTNSINFDTEVQYQIAPGQVSVSTWGQQVDYALQVTHTASNTNYYYKVSYMGVTATDNGNGIYGSNVQSAASDSAMAVDSTGTNQVFNLDYTLDFTDPSSTTPGFAGNPQFQETPLPSSLQGMSLAELVADAGPVQDTLDAPGTGGLSIWTTATLTAVGGSPELRDHPILDNFVTSMNSDPMALANYVLNEVNLSDAVGYTPSAGEPTSAETIAINSVTSGTLTTANDHGLSPGQIVAISGVTGTMASSLNGTFTVATVPGTTTLTLNTLAGGAVTLSGTYGGSGVIEPYPASDLVIASVNSSTGVITTVNKHNLHPGEYISITGAAGTMASTLNNGFLVGTTPTSTTFTLVALVPNGGSPTLSGTYTVDTGIIDSTFMSINPQGVRRDALATFLEGQGSPAEQCALLVYLLRKANCPAVYVFPNQDQMLMIDQELSNMLRIQIQGSIGPWGNYLAVDPQLVAVNYPWVAAYINGQWVHLFPWMKNTVMQEGPDLWSYMPAGYKSGAQWMLHYAQDDPTIRKLTTPGGLYTDDVNVLFPLYVQHQLQGTNLSVDQLGMHWYNQQVYYTRWQDFPRPWQTPIITDANIAQSLDYTQNPATLTPALENIFDTINIQVFSDRAGTGTYSSPDPVINTGDLRLCDIHDRRFLLYHKVTSTGTATPTYNMILSLEPFNPNNPSTPDNDSSAYTFNSNATYSGTSSPDPTPDGLQSRQHATAALTSSDDALIYHTSYSLHKQAQAVPSVNEGMWSFFLGVIDTTTLTDSRSLRKGDMACLSLNYGQVSSQMQEFEAEKYWNYQQSIASLASSSPNTPANPELSTGQLLDIMGSTYFYKVSQLQTNAEAWTKSNIITTLSHGLSKLSPLRNTSNALYLYNNDLVLCYPRVDMVINETTFVGNGTNHLNSGGTGITSSDDASVLLIGGGSADEHLTINQFFQQDAAISTMKLLDLSQGWSTTVAGNGTYSGHGTIASPALTITTATNANPSVLTTSAAHGLQAGQIITISGATGDTAINGTFMVATVPTTTTFTLAYPSGGVATNPGFGGTGQPLVLTSSNYTDSTHGAKKYNIGTATLTLSQWCGGSATPATAAPAGSIWGQIQAAFSTNSANAAIAPMTVAYITPGPVIATAQSLQKVVTNTPQQYTGVGALILSQGSYGALISPNLYVSGSTVSDNGGYGGIADDPFLAWSEPVSLVSQTMLTGIADSFNISPSLPSPYISASSSSLSSASYNYGSPSVSNISTVSLGLSLGNLVDTPQELSSVQTWLNLVDVSGAPTLSSFGSATADFTLQMASVGNIGSPDYYGEMQSNGFSVSQSVYDPVNSVTGEFYVNALDLSLNGPMPLQIRRIYGSFNQASNNFGYGWRVSYFPYLMFSNDAVYNTANTQVTTQPSLIYAAELDGSVIEYRYQSGSSSWIPLASDNPNLMNGASGSLGASANPFNNHITTSTTTVGGTTYSVYTLTGADGSVRTFQVNSYPTGTGTSTISMARPYLQKWTDNRGNYYTFSFGSSTGSPSYGQITQISSSNGDFVGFDYDVDGHITTAFTGDGRFLYYQYDSFGDLTQVTLPDASTISYNYQHNLVPANPGTVVAGNGTYVANTGTITNDGNLVISSATNTGTCTLTTATTNNLVTGNLVVISGAQGNTAINGTFTVGSVSGNTLTLLSGVAPATSDSTHLITEEVKPAGRMLENTYNSKRQVLTQLATVGSNETLVQNATFSYGTQTADTNDAGTFDGVNTITDAFGNVTTYKYTADQITEIDYPTQNTSNTNQPSTGPKTLQTWFYTTSGTAYQRSLATSTDRRGLQTSYQYDGNGNLTKVSWTGDLTGSGSSSTSATTMTYDSSGTVTLPGGGTAIPNTLASVSDQLGNGASYTYGNSSYPYEPTVVNKIAGGSTISTEQRQYGNVTNGATGAYGLLENDALASGTSDQSITTYQYNSNGFLTQKTQETGDNDPNVVTNYTYNLRGEMTSQTDAANQSTQYAYDALGHETSALRYDGTGNLVSSNFTSYNRNGDVEWIQGPRSSPNDLTFKSYDGAGRLSQNVQWLSAAQADGKGLTAGGYATTTYVHDLYGNLTGETDPDGNAITMGYDAEGEMRNRTISGPNGGSAVSSESFTYEPGGKVAGHTQMLGGTEALTYTAQGLVETDVVTDTTSGSTASGKSYLYDLTGRVTKETLSNSSYWATSYNDVSRTVTKTLFNSAGSQLMQEIRAYDRRGNLISYTDVGGNTFTSTCDGLGRAKSVTGPPAAGSSAQQTQFYVYDAAGQLLTVTNGAGERTNTFFDALGRKTLVSMFNADGSVASNTGYWYSPDHQSVVETAGSGASGSANPAVSTTTYTDTRGNPLIVRHSDSSFQAMVYDANGNKIAAQNEQGNQTVWSYDALNRVLVTTLPGGQTTTKTYTLNSPGETIQSAMSTGSGSSDVTQQTTYDSIGRETGEVLDGTGGGTTRQYSYSYYSGTGLLHTVTDPRGFTTTTSYDDWMRPSAVASGGSGFTAENTSYSYDNRGMITTVAQSYATATTGPSTEVTRGYDAYGQMSAETVYLNSTGSVTFGSGNIVSQWAQTWDNTGRRTGLTFGLAAQGSGDGKAYTYQYNALGLLTKVTNNGQNYQYSYGDNGLMTQRVTPYLTQGVNTRDGRGRILTQSTTSSSASYLSETLGWRNDDKLTSYADTGSAIAISESRSYQYDARGRVTEEPYYLTQSTETATLMGQQYAQYQFDGGIAGLGIRTVQGVSTSPTATTFSSGNFVNSLNSFGQSTQDLTIPLNVLANNYTLPSATVNFTPDAAGNMTGRSPYVGSSGVAPQTLTWDASNQLVGVSVPNNSSQNAPGYTWKTTYDGFGRRVQTAWQNINYDGSNGTSFAITYFYDPQVKYLELGHDYGGRSWNVYGPDKSGTYGGDQGIGGLEAVITENNGNSWGEVNDFFGNAVAVTAGGGATPGTWNSALGGYGEMPGSLVNTVFQAQWRGHYEDPTGFYYMGARYYEPASGRFLSADPMGQAGSMDLYSYCNGDPVNGIDPTGAFGVGTNVESAGYNPDTMASLVGQPDAMPDWSQISMTPEQESQRIDALPFVGGLKLIAQGLTGYNAITGQYVSTQEQLGDFALGALQFTPLGLDEEAAQAEVDMSLGSTFAENVEETQAGLNAEGAAIAEGGASGAMVPENSALTENSFAPGEVMPNGRTAGEGPGAMLSGENLGSNPYAAEGMTQGPLLSPSDINFSQRTVKQNNYAAKMENGAWDWSRSDAPITVMQREGQWVTYDNRRLLAAQQAKLDSIPVIVVQPTDLRKPGQTWEQAFQTRFSDPRNVNAGGVVPNGGLSTPPTILPTN